MAGIGTWEGTSRDDLEALESGRYDGSVSRPPRKHLGESGVLSDASVEIERRARIGASWKRPVPVVEPHQD
jgi:hypothetical protein